MRVLIPKAASEQARWQSELKGRDIDICFVDPWQVDVLPETAAMRSSWLNLDINRTVFCVSPTAAQVLVDALDQYWPMPPAGVRWLCNGPRTASVLSQIGLKAEYPESGHTSEDVYALIKPVIKAADRCLIIKGEGGREWLANQLQQQNVHVSTIKCYRRSVDVNVLNNMIKLAQNVDALWLSSECLGDHLIDNNEQFWRNWSGQWWLSSRRLVDWAKQQKLHNIEQVNGATPQALNSLLISASKNQGSSVTGKL